MVSCKDLRAGGRDSLKAGEETSLARQKPDAKIIAITGNRVREYNDAECGERMPDKEVEKEKTHHQHVLLPKTKGGAMRWVEFSLKTKREEGKPLLLEDQ